jgi:hypothetical protein
VATHLSAVVYSERLWLKARCRRGFLPNMLKNLPTNSVRLASFDGAKKLIQEADVAMMELRAQLNFKPSKSTALC